MGVFGFGNVGGAVADETTAGFPTSGLVALYKCDERTGDKLYDATGSYPEIQLYSGVALNCTSNLCYVRDNEFGVQLRGLSADLICGCDIITPASTGSATEHNIFSGNLAGNASARMYLTEGAGVDGTRVFSVAFRCALSSSEDFTASFGTGSFTGLPASTAVQIGMRVSAASGTPTAYLCVRYPGGDWQYYSKAEGSSAGSYTLAGTETHWQLFVRGAASPTTSPFAGHVSSVFIAHDAGTIEDCAAVFDLGSPAQVAVALGDNARYWDFGFGTGTTCEEWIEDTSPTISTTGTVTWAQALAGVRQQALLQNAPAEGKSGIHIGGETDCPVTGYGASGVGRFGRISGDTGWSFLATLRVGPDHPASTQYLASAFAPRPDGSYSTNPLKQRGVHIGLNTSGQIMAYWVDQLEPTDDDGRSQALGSTTDADDNGALGTYVISCDSAGVVTTRRVVLGDSSVTTQATSAASVDDLLMSVSRFGFGNTSFDADLIVGYMAAYNRPLTDSEIMQCHKASVARMKRPAAQVFLLAAADGGNGGERHPYKLMHSAMRTLQDGATLNLGAGDYTRITTETAVVRCHSSASSATVIGAGAAVTSVLSSDVEGGTGHPVHVNRGNWVLVDLTADAQSLSTSGINAGVTIDGTSRTKSLTCRRVHATNALAGTSSGAGIVTRAESVELIDCECSDNGEHGVYLRIADTVAGDHTFRIENLYCHGNTEDGLKFASDETDPNLTERCSWVGYCDRLRVEGGRRQLWIEGVSGSVFTNTRLHGSFADVGESANPLLTGGALRLGHPSGAETDVDTEDGCWNNTIANITITGAAGWAVYDARSVGTTIQNLICEGNARDYSAGSEGTAVITYAAGDATTDKLPAGTGNIIDATIAFTNAAGGDYTLTEASDGYGDGVNLTGLSDEAESDFAGTARPATGAWNMGAY